MNRLQGKYALITGASQGLGRQLAIDFARNAPSGGGALHSVNAPYFTAVFN